MCIERLWLREDYLSSQPKLLFHPSLVSNRSQLSRRFRDSQPYQEFLKIRL
jgi:hypothetical protein